MNQDDAYYLMPVNFAKTTIPALYHLAQTLTGEGLFDANASHLAGATHELLERISRLNEEEELRMNFGECALVYHIMVKVKIALHTMFPALNKKEVKEKLPVNSETILKANADLEHIIDKVTDDMCETFPQFNPEVNRVRNELHRLDLSFRKMEVDNEEAVIRFYLNDNLERKFFLLVFQVFDLAVFQIEYEFSKDVREADFFYESDFKAVFKKLKETIDTEAIDSEDVIELNLTLRDAVVVYIACNITQKLFLTDAGDDIMAIFNRVSVDLNNGMSATDLRSMYLQMAARINEAIEEGTTDEEIFAAYIEPVKEFTL